MCSMDIHSQIKHILWTFWLFLQAQVYLHQEVLGRADRQAQKAGCSTSFVQWVHPLRVAAHSETEEWDPMSDQAFRSRQWWCLQVGNAYCGDQNYVSAMWFKLQCSSSVLSKLLLVQLATPSDLFLDPPCPEIDWELSRSCNVHAREKKVSLAESYCFRIPLCMRWGAQWIWNCFWHYI